ncbi:hypothetical protein [Microvirga makkahensis]|uniref:Uncharacterized protein n=1 Tax=Microvirga makkahensis TaxID=1128670 RepID=A0A7X3MNA6_9HYPH|nr:hypothetical protein [Microvirga makkahensis]MXQ10231.1 hypothetical protein [Microvirga makkahensis]
MTGAWSDPTIHLVKATVPALQEHGLATSWPMSPAHVRAHVPERGGRNLFNLSLHGETGSQPRCLDKVPHRVHRTPNDSTRAMRDHVRSLAEAHPDLRAATFRRVATEDRLGEDYDHEGLISVEWLRANTPLDEAAYYLCCPRPLLWAFVGGLALAAVRSKRIHYGFLGSADESLAAV